MSGLRMIMPDAVSYDGNAIDNALWIEKFILAAASYNVVFSDPVKVALRALYASFVAAGIDKKMDVFRIAFSGNTQVDSLNWLNPKVNDAAYPVAFSSDLAAAHTLSGIQYNTTTGLFGTSTYKIKAVQNLHLSVWNTTPSDGTGSGYLLGSINGTAPNQYNIYLNRKANIFALGKTSIGGPSGYDVTKIGQISAARNITAVTIYEAGASVKTGTDANTMTADGTISMKEGNVQSGTGFGTNAKIFKVRYGAFPWADADEQIEYTAVRDFKTAIGA